METFSADEIRQMMTNHEVDRVSKLERQVAALAVSNHPAPRWEYMVTTGSLASLNPMGAEGWELVAAWPKPTPNHPSEPDLSSPYFVWKRRA